MFGRRREKNLSDQTESQLNGEATGNGHTNGVAQENGNKKNPSEMAIYEQFQRQEKQNGQLPPSGMQDRTEKPVKSLVPAYESAEMRTLAESLTRDIIRGSPDVKWESIKGLGTAKHLLKEAVVMPIKYPKQCLQCKTTFFNISASSVVSKWRGDSEKLIKVLFELARHHAPSTIFLDEIDAIISQRGEGRSEHEASRRLKTELLIQMDGLTKTNELVFVLAATNLPWELDAAMLRRLEKPMKILVPLPEPEARRAMFEELLPSTGDSELPYDILVDSTEGYSGSDIRLVCKEAAMQPLRRLMTHLEQEGDSLGEDPEVGPILGEDVELALRNTRPSAHLHAHRYEQFNKDYGSHVL
ncbi:Katanin p60 ATPase-containing subunit A-like 2 [Nymphaea thermarum]|nr:Katanin p60 ATPase-containing subunit A-like 2 [Nymphaea thermarum]